MVSQKKIMRNLNLLRRWANSVLDNVGSIEANIDAMAYDLSMTRSLISELEQAEHEMDMAARLVMAAAVGVRTRAQSKKGEET